MITPARTFAQTPQTLAQAPIPQADLERKRRMKDAWKWYRGDVQAPLKVERDQPDDNVLSNRCAPIVEKGVSFLFGKSLKIEATDEQSDDPNAQTPVQDYLDGMWGDDDDKMTTLAKLATNGGVCGQPFLKLIPPQGAMQYPRVVVLNPELVRVVTPPDDCELVCAYIVEYPSGPSTETRQIYARVDPDGLAGTLGEADLDDTWTISTYTRSTLGSGSASDWRKQSQTAWPYPFAPIFSCQNLPNPNEFWGAPDLPPDICEMNRVLNFVQSNTSRIIKYHGHPKTWAKGTNTQTIDVSVDGLILLQSPDAELGMLAPMSEFTGLLSFAANLRADMDEQSRVPAVALRRTAELPKGNISGVALQLLFQPLIEKTVLKQRLYGRLIREVCRAALVLAGLITLAQYEDYPIELHWQNLLPVDDLAAAQTSLILKQIGVSTETLLQELGYSYDVEVQKTQVEATQQVTDYAQGRGLPPAQAPQVDSQQQQQAGMGQT